MKDYNSHLFDLIKSLDPAEKRYFKIYAAKQIPERKKSYVQLFDALDSGIINNEAAVIQRLNKRKIVQKSGFASLKNYLYDIILKSEVAYYYDSNIHYRLNHLLLSAEILKSKALFKQSENALVKAEKLARSVHAISDLIKILKQHLFLLTWYIEGISPETESKLKELYKEIKELQHQEGLEIDYRLLFSQLYICSASKNEKKINGKLIKLMEFSNHPLLKQKNIPSAFLPRLGYYTCHYFICYNQRDWERCYFFSSNILKLLNKYPSWVKEYRITYIIYLNNHLEQCCYVRKSHEFFETLSKLVSIKSNQRSIKASIFYLRVQNELTYFLMNKDYKKGLDLLPGIERGLNEFAENFNPFIIFDIYFSIAQLFFHIKNYNESMKWVKKFILKKEAKSHQRIYKGSRLLYLILLLETSNNSLLESELKSFYYYERKTASPNLLLRVLLNALRKKMEEKTNMTLSGELTQLTKQSNYQEWLTDLDCFNGFNFVNWIEKRLCG